jgi:hypothetical protein
MQMGHVRITAIAALFSAVACGGSVTTSQDAEPPLKTLAQVAPEQWASLAQQRIFFGHQSVGGNIVAGITDIVAQHPSVRLNVVESRDLAGRREPGFYHALVGRNDYPIEKFDDFVALSSAAFDGPGIAMLKLCYTDMHKQTNAETLFADYQRRIVDLRARNPQLTIVHFTTPLTGIENWKGRLMSSVKGFTTQRERNAIRHRYNELMRAAYEGKEPLFDVAKLESTLPDGRRITFRAGAEDVPFLAPEYSDDGGHLNAAARQRVAEQLLVLLAQVNSTATKLASGTAR